MNAVADKIGKVFVWYMLIVIDGAVVRVGDVVELLRIEEPRPFSDKLDLSRMA